MRKSVPCLIFLVICCAAAGCSPSRPGPTLHFVRADGQSTPAIRAELARTQGERTLGLMYRKELAANEGMLFVFPEEAERSFWMKNTYLELDMVFLNHDLEVVSCIERAVPLSETPRPSGKSAQYVLELRGGSVSRWGIKAGDKLVSDSPIPGAQ